MNPQPDPTERFLISMIARAVKILLTPYYYAARSDMGVQWTALTTLLFSCAIYAAAIFIPTTLNAAVFGLRGQTSRVNFSVISLYVLLLVLGFVRNTVQAWRRRRRRDWSVHSWSTGRPLLEPMPGGLPAMGRNPLGEAGGLSCSDR
jgi:hypothetical protein